MVIVKLAGLLIKKAFGIRNALPGTATLAATTQEVPDNKNLKLVVAPEPVVAQVAVQPLPLIGKATLVLVDRYKFEAVDVTTMAAPEVKSRVEVKPTSRKSACSPPTRAAEPLDVVGCALTPMIEGAVVVYTL